MAEKQNAGRDNLGQFAPQLAALNDDVLFGEAWSREGALSAHDRSMITVAGLMGAGNIAQLEGRIPLAKAHGVTKGEMVEIITQRAFYCGWPRAWLAFTIAKKTYGEG